MVTWCLWVGLVLVLLRRFIRSGYWCRLIGLVSVFGVMCGFGVRVRLRVFIGMLRLSVFRLMVMLVIWLICVSFILMLFIRFVCGGRLCRVILLICSL